MNDFFQCKHLFTYHLKDIQNKTYSMKNDLLQGMSTASSTASCGSNGPLAKSPRISNSATSSPFKVGNATTILKIILIDFFETMFGD